MFIIRRRSDGRYWRNDQRGSWRQKDKDAWVTDLQDVKPFRTKGAAMHSVHTGGSSVYEWNKNNWEKKNPPCCLNVKWSTYGGHKNKCEHFKAAQQADVDRWHANYELVPVKLSLEE